MTPGLDQVSPLFENQRDKFEEPSSAISLAISAILALIPCPQDPIPLEPESIRWRRAYSQFFAKAALESIETETERPESSVSPPRALDDSDDEIFREKFHSQVPLELESIIALDLLSVYEYAQRGNLKKMRARVGAALVSAMSQMLHVNSDDEDEYSEARRRTWWMTYICVCQGSIVSNTPPTFEVFASSFTAKYPMIKADPDAWPLFIQAQQAILAATQFVIDFNKARKEQSDMNRIFNRMRDLERLLEPLITKSESWVLNCPLTQLVDRRESVLSQSLRCISRIKLNSARIKVHRYCAFFDLAVFSGKHCDLKSTTEKDTVDSPDVIQLQSCCTTLSSTPSVHSSPSGGSVSPTLSSRSTPNTDCCGFTYQPAPVMTFPFSTHQSSKICLKSALNIAQAFDSLPYPNPSGLLCDTPCYIGPNSTLITPRTMPSFACCAMQCSYALLMVKDRTETMYPTATGEAGPLVDNLRDRLQQGLVSILVTLENYATAFEALGGMRDQIRDKVDLALGF
ncbi:C6 zinc finger domain-containing protein [Daldinia childiae]|uniref:C6 zinc finger domain-containing protein n=1 Tax=Daldinia childiae TaxID=326645 RepID=UPI0014488379|nr:C6 zinc finger domain-containing protein [Daldinia childiae]KAF3065017.1 C6 zinc finger domain-containing protein [Daldinia childiae]